MAGNAKLLLQSARQAFDDARIFEPGTAGRQSQLRRGFQSLSAALTCSPSPSEECNIRIFLTKQLVAHTKNFDLAEYHVNLGLARVSEMKDFGIMKLRMLLTYSEVLIYQNNMKAAETQLRIARQLATELIQINPDSRHCRAAYYSYRFFSLGFCPPGSHSEYQELTQLQDSTRHPGHINFIAGFIQVFSLLRLSRWATVNDKIVSLKALLPHIPDSSDQQKLYDMLIYAQCVARLCSGGPLICYSTEEDADDDMHHEISRFLISNSEQALDESTDYAPIIANFAPELGLSLNLFISSSCFRLAVLVVHFVFSVRRGDTTLAERCLDTIIKLREDEVVFTDALCCQLLAITYIYGTILFVGQLSSECPIALIDLYNFLIGNPANPFSDAPPAWFKVYEIYCTGLCSQGYGDFKNALLRYAEAAHLAEKFALPDLAAVSAVNYQLILETVSVDLSGYPANLLLDRTKIDQLIGASTSEQTALAVPLLSSLDSDAVPLYETTAKSPQARAITAVHKQVAEGFLAMALLAACVPKVSSDIKAKVIKRCYKEVKNSKSPIWDAAMHLIVGSSADLSMLSEQRRRFLLEEM